MTWLLRRELQLIISPAILSEYLAILQFLDISPSYISWFESRLKTISTVTFVNPGKRFRLSRDIKDNVFIDAAHVGRAKYLVTNDKDLLEIPERELQGLRFRIVTPNELLASLSE